VEELHLGDCFGPTGLVTLEDDSVDHLVTDPPYSEHVHKAVRTSRLVHEQGPARNVELGFAHITDEDRRRLAEQAARLVRRWSLIFSDIEGISPWVYALEAVGLQHVRTMIWRRLDATPQFSGDRPASSCEAIVLCHRPGKKRWNGGGKHGFYAAAVVQNCGRTLDGARVHPTQKPLSLMAALIRDFTDTGELIVDPFAGSATTLVAAKRLGRRALGWERDELFYQRGCKRIDEAKEQLSLL